MIFRVRQIPSCPGYFASDTGRIWGPQKELKPVLRKNYPTFSASANGQQRAVCVHHAVAEAFLGPRPPGAWVCHRNDDTFDNRVENLYYGDASTNAKDAYRNGGRCTRGERNGNAKLNWDQVRNIRRRHANGEADYNALAEEYGVTYQTIYQVVNHLRWATPAGGCSMA